MKLSTNKPCVWSIAAALLLAACGSETPPSPSVLSAHFSIPSNINCTAPSIDDVRAPLQRLLVQSKSDTGAWATYQSVSGPFDGAQTYDIQPPADVTHAMRVLACQQGASEWVAYGPSAFAPHGAETLRLNFTPTSALSCTDTIDSTGANQRNRWPDGGAFGASAVTGTGVHLFGGGVIYDSTADAFVGTGFEAPTVYDEGEGTFARLDVNIDPALHARLGAVAVPLEVEGQTGIAIIGGTTGLRRDPVFLFGPLVPVKPADAGLSPGCHEGSDAAIFVATDGTVRPIEPTALPFLGRVFGQTASAGGTTVIAGGIQCGDGNMNASHQIELVESGTVSRLELPVRLAGATVSSIGDNRFLVWGYDVDNCGQQPGWIITTSPTPRVDALRLDFEVPNTCGEQPVTCPEWHPSGYHTATPLPASAGAPARVLVVGGLIGRRDGLSNNPTVREACPGNGFILEIDGAEATLETVAREPGTPSSQRAFHAAARVGSQVLISGGWVGAVERGMSPANPGALYASDRWFIYDDATKQLRAGGALAQARLGHAAVNLTQGRVLISGGLRPELNTAAPFQMSDIGEIWTPAITPDACATSSDNSG